MTSVAPTLLLLLLRLVFIHMWNRSAALCSQGFTVVVKMSRRIGATGSSFPAASSHYLFVNPTPPQLTTPSASRLSSTTSSQLSSLNSENIELINEQSSAQVKEEELIATMARIREAIGYSDYGVSLTLMEDQDMQELNARDRNVDAPTDILSYPMHAPIEPGFLEEPEFDIPDLYTLGDMALDVPYVMRRIEEDRSCNEDGSNEHNEDDRGVSGAMSQVYDLDTRLQQLLVHGMLHLVGYDHEEDDDYELMLRREEELLEELGLPLPPSSQRT